MKANLDRVRFPKLGPLDYGFMIGGPIFFLLFAIYGMYKVIGPLPATSPVQRIKDGEIQPGTKLDDVLHRLGKPKEVDANADGSVTVIYVRTIADPDLQTEEGVIQVSSGGTVVSTTIERQLPTRPGS